MPPTQPSAPSDPTQQPTVQPTETPEPITPPSAPGTVIMPTPDATPAPEVTPAPDAAPAAAAPVVEAPVAAAIPPVDTAAPTGGNLGVEEAPHGWNWGAFFLSWVWGIFNGVWISLLALIPFVSIIMIFVLGAKGTEWAWKADKKKDIVAFKRRQHLWAVWAVWLFLAGLLLSFLGGVLLGILGGAASLQTRAVAVGFIDDLQKGDTSSAYKLTSKSFQSSVTEADFASEVGSAKSGLTSCTVDKATDSVNVPKTGDATATVTIPCGSAGSIQVSLVKESDGWKVSDLGVAGGSSSTSDSSSTGTSSE